MVIKNLQELHQIMSKYIILNKSNWSEWIKQMSIFTSTFVPPRPPPLENCALKVITNIEIAQRAIFMEQNIRFGLILGQLAILKNKLGRSCTTF